MSALPPPTRSWSRGRLLAVDLGLASAYAFMSASLLAPQLEPPLLTAAVAALFLVAVATCRRHPATALVAAVAAAALSPVAPRLSWLALPPLALALAVTAMLARRRTAVLALAFSMIGPVATGLPDFEHRGAIAPFACVLLAAWTTGRAAGHQRQSAEALLRGRIQAERMRIARELHDVLAHSISLVTVQAGLAQLVLETRPEQARQLLGSIETTGRESLDELRATLGLLRDERPPDGAASLAPAPGLEDLPRLVDHAAQAGVTVELSLSGERAALPAGLEVAVFRIVQEALTNVVRHAGTDVARARVQLGARRVVVEVTDSGTGSDPVTDGGHGLLGIQERVHAYGGELTAGPLPGGGFRVRATLPLPAAVRSSA